jgi:hypothetical protein
MIFSHQYSKSRTKRFSKSARILFYLIHWQGIWKLMIPDQSRGEQKGRAIPVLDPKYPQPNPRAFDFIDGETNKDHQKGIGRQTLKSLTYPKYNDLIFIPKLYKA